MKRILSVVFVLLFCKTSFGADIFCQNTTPGTVVIFGNGIMNTEKDAGDSRDKLEELLRSTLTQEEASKLKFALAYNKSYGFFRDLYESAKQKALSENLPVAFWRWLGNREIMPDTLQEELKAMATRFDFSTMVGAEDLNNHVMLYRTSMLEGKKVLVVSHSQGNLFVNAAYEKLFTGGSALTTTQSFGVVAVANPASFVGGGGPYSTLAEDAVINTVRLVSVVGAAEPLPANLTNFPLPIVDPLRHFFVESYLYPGSPSETKILNDIVLMMQELVQPPQIAQPGAITATLTWKTQPDVDLHAFEFLGPISAHVFYNNKIGLVGQLDVDDVYQYGPEHYTASCSMLQAGTYRIGVNYYYGALPETAQVQIAAGTSVRSFTRDLPTALGQAGNDNPVPVADIVVTGDQQNGFTFDIREVFPSKTPTITFGQF